MTINFDVVLRPCRHEDLDQISYLTDLTSYGLSSLVKDEIFLKNKIEKSLNSFSKSIQSPFNEEYLFVLENIHNQQLIGLSAILASTGSTKTYYSFKISKELHSCPSLKIFKEHELLHLVEIKKGPTELCSLFLNPQFRKHHLSKLLSFGRFHFIEAFPIRFNETIVTQLRGVIDDNGFCPFYDGVCKHFFEKSYLEASNLRNIDDSFIKTLLPDTPIYINVLPKATQEVIGKCHIRTQPALKMILDQGFFYSGEIDIFDGGPDLYANFKDIKTVKSMNKKIVKETIEEIQCDNYYIISNLKQNFRACYGRILKETLEEVVIEERTRKALQIEIGEPVIISLIQK